MRFVELPEDADYETLMRTISSKFAFGPSEYPKLEYQGKSGNQDLVSSKDFEDMLHDGSAPVLAIKPTQEENANLRTLYISVVEKEETE